MASSELANIKVEPMQVIWGGDDLGFTEGDISISFNEDYVDVTAHQFGTDIRDRIQTGSTLELSLVLKETDAAQTEQFLLRGASKTTPVAEVSLVTAIVETGLDGTFFTLNAANDSTGYYVFFDLDGSGSDPAPAGLTPIQVLVLTADGASGVATKMAAAITGIGDFGASADGDDVTITNAATGPSTDLADSDTLMTLCVLSQGVGAIAGFGSSLRFKNQSENAAPLRLHPVALADSDESRDIYMSKAFPVLDSLTFSGENPATIEITFNIIPDTALPIQVEKMKYGEGK